MTREELLAELEYYTSPGDTEIAHARADELLCQWLVQLGYADIVAMYQRIEKWYG